MSPLTTVCHRMLLLHRRTLNNMGPYRLNGRGTMHLALQFRHNKSRRQSCQRRDATSTKTIGHFLKTPLAVSYPIQRKSRTQYSSEKGRWRTRSTRTGSCASQAPVISACIGESRKGWNSLRVRSR